MKKKSGVSFDGLLTPDTKSPQQAPVKVKGNYKTFCYSIPPATGEKIRQIAKWDRKTLGAVVTEAFEQYAENWEPLMQKPPKFKNSK